LTHPTDGAIIGVKKSAIRGEGSMTEGQILIVQPDANSAYRLQNTLEYQGYETFVVNRGQEAWEFCRSKQPQAIVLDTDLPDMSGLELLRRIRRSSRTRQIHVIALIRKHAPNDQIVGLEMGADDSIVKPYDVQEVCLRIRNAVRRADTGILVNPITGLPGGRFVEDQLRRLLRRQDEWALLRIAIRQRDDHTSPDGALADEDALRAVARELTEQLDGSGCTDDFIGHSGTEAFIVITSAETGQRLKTFLSEDLGAIKMTEELPPLELSLDVQMVTAADGPFQDIMQLTSALD
jgi:DNA-binding response OmpR family regulator